MRTRNLLRFSLQKEEQLHGAMGHIRNRAIMGTQQSKILMSSAALYPYLHSAECCLLRKITLALQGSSTNSTPQ